MLEFEGITDEDITKFLNAYPVKQFEDFRDYVVRIKIIITNILATTMNEETVYLLITVLSRLNVQAFNFQDISETTLEVLLKSESRVGNNMKAFNIAMHSYKFKLFSDYLYLQGEEKGRILKASDDTIKVSKTLTIDKKVPIHYKVLDLLTNKYEDIEKVSATIIIDDINNVYTKDKYQKGQKGYLFQGSKLMIFSEQIQRLDYERLKVDPLDYNRMLFFINILTRTGNTFEHLQADATRAFLKANFGELRSYNVQPNPQYKYLNMDLDPLLN